MQRKVTFKADATYNYQLNSSTVTVDRLVAKGVTIGSGALFAFTDLGAGTLTSGTVFTVISNTAATPISGAFSNLAGYLDPALVLFHDPIDSRQPEAGTFPQLFRREKRFKNPR